MVELWFALRDGRRICLPQITEPEAEQQLLLHHLKWSLNGLIATQCICKEFPKTKVLVLSMHNNQEYLVQAIQGGACGFALKNSRPEELVKAINIVHRGEPFFPGQSASFSQSLFSKRDATNRAVLCDREKEVLIHLATGFSNKEIADVLKISVRTVESHRARLIKKLNIHTSQGLRGTL
jgi:DNA-binding NarL/FixJ family response regulator